MKIAPAASAAMYIISGVTKSATSARAATPVGPYGLRLTSRAISARMAPTTAVTMPISKVSAASSNAMVSRVRETAS